MTLASIRSLLYSLARILGDVQAVRRGRIGQRKQNRVAGRLAGRLLRRILRQNGIKLGLMVKMRLTS